MNNDAFGDIALRRDGMVLHATFNRPDRMNAFIERRPATYTGE